MYKYSSDICSVESSSNYQHLHGTRIEHDHFVQFTVLNPCPLGQGVSEVELSDVVVLVLLL